MKLPTPPKPVRRVKIKRNDHLYWLNIMPASYMQKIHLSGFAINNEAYISEELRGKHRAFVINHEIYHLNDKQKWLGYFGMELRANTVCGLKDPVGFLATVLAGIKNKKLLTYVKALFGNNYRA